MEPPKIASAVMGVSPTLWEKTFSPCFSSRSQPSSLPSCRAKKNKEGRVGDQQPAVMGEGRKGVLKRGERTSSAQKEARQSPTDA